ncbi:DUF4347 domain-containing protein [Anabaena sp. UHCC 0399]|uniref:DUF4347 domain-containing protein n=1 Tax=Anabaena sp. UHCC 0399 TaxID=3110238 RepID=UPI002B1F44F2|nr:DUF4347 domain-containing protein [Anabaena sp. UHCC 0399]MEA5569032.1 DUF4347 domain-containing protein [Anabaena sp. UHCC 0399]
MELNHINPQQQQNIIPVDGSLFAQKSDLEILGTLPNQLTEPLYYLNETIENKILSIESFPFADNINLITSTSSTNIFDDSNNYPHDSLIIADIVGQTVSTWHIDSLIGNNSQQLTVINQPKSTQEIIFLDTTVDNYQSLIKGVESGAEVVLLDAKQDGIIQISQVLSQRSDISAIHIISHGSSGRLQLGNAQLTENNLQYYSEALDIWAKALTENADILLYGCNVAEGIVGTKFVNQLSHLTEADVAASDNLTGNTQLGGDWILEYQFGSIETDIAFNLTTTYANVLGVTVNTIGNQLSFIGTSGNDNLYLKNDSNSLAYSIDGSNFNNISLLGGLTSISVDLQDGVDQFYVTGDWSTYSGNLSVFSEIINVDTLTIGQSNNLAGALQFSAIASGNITSQSQISFLNSNIFANSLFLSATSSVNNTFTGSSLTIQNNALASITGGVIKVNSLDIKSETKGSVVSAANYASIQNQVTDSAIALLENTTINVATSLNLNALSSSIYKASGVQATNNISGDVTAYITNSTITSGIGGVNIYAQDASQVTAESTGLNYDFSQPNPIISLDISQAYNNLSRSVTAYINNNSDITVTNGDIRIIADKQTKLSSSAKAATATASVSLVVNASLSGGGTFAANAVQGDVKAYINTSTIKTLNTGSIQLQAKDHSAINAISESGGLTVSSTADIGVNGSALTNAIAFNTIGWQIDNLLGKAINTLLSIDIADVEKPANVQAYITNSNVTTNGNLSLTATSESQINSTVSNAATSTASSLFGAKALTSSTILASNRISSTTNAYIDGSTNKLINVSGKISLLAEDKAGIYANSKIVASSIVTNDGGVNVLNNGIGLLTADYTTGDGNKNLIFGNKVKLEGNYNTTPNADLTKTVFLNTGDLVEIAKNFTGKGNVGSVYRYLGSAQSRDIYTQNYNDDSLWQEVGKANTVYKYLGTSTTGTNLNLKAQNYNALDYWKEVLETQLIPQGNNITDSDAIAVGGLVVLNDVRSDVQAYITNATINAQGEIKVEAIENATLIAEADSSANASGGSAYGSGTVVAANGIIATNTVLSAANAYITNSTITTTSGDLIVDAQNTSIIEAINKATTTSGDTAVGVVLAFNTIGWNPQNLLFNAIDALVNTNIGTQQPAQVKAYIENSTANIQGNINIQAQGKTQLTATVSNESTSAASAIVNASGMSIGGILASNMVSSEVQAYIRSTTSTNTNITATGDITINANDATGIKADTTLQAISSTSNDGGVSLANNLFNTLINEYQYTSKSGTQTVNQYDQVRLASDWSDSTQGTAGKVYQYIGSTPLANIDLASQNYTDSSKWKQLSINNVLPTGLNVTDSDSQAYGGLIVRNDVITNVDSFIHQATIQAASIAVTAQETATLEATTTSIGSSSGGSAYGTGKSIAVNGTIATNSLLGDTQAYITNSNVTTSSDLTVSADHNAKVDATLNSSVTTGNQGVGVAIAFNTLGWKTQNLLYNTIDALLGTNIGNEQPATAKAYIQNSQIQVGANLNVLANSQTQLNATVSNAATSVASALFNATGMSVGAILASNKVSSAAQAYIEQPIGTVQVGDTLTISAQDNVGIYSNSKIVSSSITTNVGGADILDNKIKQFLNAKYDTADGLKNLKFGERVRLGADYGNGGKAGSVYEYLGTGNSLDLSNTDYTNLDYWKEVLETQLIPQGNNITDSDAIAVGGLVVLNDVRSDVQAYITNATINAQGEIKVEAIENATLIAEADSSANASGGSAYGSGTVVAANGIIATNTVLSAANAYITNSTITTTSGDLIVDAQNTSIIEAINKATTTSGDTAVGVVLAFNSVGWKTQNVLFNTIDALLGDPAISAAMNGEKPAEVKAYIEDSTIDVVGSVAVTAVSKAQIDANVSNESTSAASALYGASGISVGVVLATNKVNSTAKAYIGDNPDDPADALSTTVNAQGNISVIAKDEAGIKADSILKAISSTTNDGGASILGGLANKLLTEYSYTTNSGVQEVKYGDKVRIASNYSGAGTKESLYRYIGQNRQSFNLGSQNYANTSLWQKLDPVDISTIIPTDKLRLNISDSDSIGVGALIVFNDVRSDVASFINQANIIATNGNIQVTSLEAATIVAKNESTVTSDGGSILGSGTSVAVNAVIVTNTVLSAANAFISNGTAKTLSTGNISVDAQNTSSITALVDNTTTSKQASVGVTLAFNTIGWKSQNFLFNTVDALFGTNIGDKQPVQVQAYIKNAQIQSVGAVSVTTTYGTNVDAQVKTSATSVNVSLNKSPAISVGANITLNKISSQVRSYIEGSTLLEANNGDLTLATSDVSKITSNVNAPTLAVGLGTGSTISASVGLSIARNEIDNHSEAFVKNSGSAANPIKVNGTVSITAHKSATIEASSAASAIGVSASTSSSTSFSGGGATAINYITGKANAFIEGSTIGNSNNKVNSATLQGTNQSTIKAEVKSTAVAVGLGTGTTRAFAIGFSLANNFIGWSDSNTKSSLEVLAYITNSSVATSGAMNLLATSNSQIDATVAATTVAVGISSGSSGGLSGAGVFTENKVAALVKAYIADTNSVDGKPTNIVANGGINLTSADTSKISADAQAVAVGASLSGSNGGSLSIGFSIARNTIENEIEAYITNAAVITSNVGNIMLSATENNKIKADSVAAAVSVGISAGTAGFALSGGGAEATNIILNKTNAYISGSALGAINDQIGNLSLTALGTSDIDATVGAVAASVTFGGKAGVGVAIGVAIAQNLIGYKSDGTRSPAEIQAYISNSSVNAAGTLTQTATASETVDAIVLAGSVAIAAGGKAGVGLSGAGVSAENKIVTLVKAFVDGDGATGIQARTATLTASDSSTTIDATIATVSLSAGVGGTAGVGVSIGAAVANNFIGYNDNSRQSAEVQAYIQNSSLNVSGNLTLSATANGIITALVGAGSAAVAGGGTAGVGASGAGVSAENKIATLVKAFVNGDGATGIQARTATLTASDSSTIKADAGAASIAASLGGTAGVSLSIGVALANNLISNEVEAFINNADNSFTTTTGGVSLSATTNANIQALSVAASLAAGFGGTAGVAISGAGAAAVNTILTKTNAYIKGSVINSAGAVSLTATNSATIDATIAAVSLSAGVGGTAGVGVSIGAAVANNFIGYDDNSRQPAEVQAYIQNSSVTAGGDLTLNATSGGTITAKVGAGSVALAGGGAAGVAASGSGVSTKNKIATFVKAFIDGDGATGIQARSATLSARDTSTIKADAGAASIAASLGGAAGVSLSIGVALASNLISNEVAAFINNADNSVRTTTGDVSISATTSANIQALAVAASIAAGFGGAAGVAISGAGADSTNSIFTKTNAYIKDSVINSVGAVKVDAKNTAGITAKIGAASAAVGGGTVGVGASIGVAIARNQIGWDLDLTDTNYKYTTGSGERFVNKGDRVLIQEGARAGDIYEFIGDPATIKLQTADYSNTSNWKQVNLKQNAAEVLAYVERSSINAGGTLALAALSDSTIEATVESTSVAVAAGLAGASLSGAGVSTENKIATKVQAFISGDGATGISASSISLKATDESRITANAEAASIAATFAIGAAISVGVSIAKNEIGNDVRAFVQNVNNSLRATSGDIQLTAIETATITTTSIAASAAVGLVGIAGSGAMTLNTINNRTQSYISGSNQVTSQGNVVLTSRDTSTIQSLAGQVSGGTTAAIGASVATNNSSSTTQAYISDSTVTSTTGYVKAIAETTGKIKSASAGASVAGGVALTGSVSINNIANITDAYARNAIISSVSGVEISAQDAAKDNEATIQSLAGQLSGGMAAGIGAALAYNNIANVVRAYVTADNGKFTTIDTLGNVIIQAFGTSKIDTIAAGGSAGLLAGIGGSFAVNEMNNNVSASVQNNSSIKARGSVGVLANSTNSINTTGGTLSAGFVGVGGTIAVNNLENTTRAYVNNSSIDGVGEQSITIPKADGSGTTESFQGVAVLATSKDSVDVTIGTAGGGGLAFLASVAINSFQNTTEAYGNNVAINASVGSAIPEQSLYIKAFNDSTVDVSAGTAGGGLAAVGIGLDITTMKNATTAYINSSDLINSQGSLVKANKDLVVEAKTQKSVTSNVVALGGGGLSVQGAVSIINVSSGMSSKGSDAIGDTESKVNEQLKGWQANANIKDISGNFATSLPTLKGTTAFIAGTASAGENLIVNAYETTKLKIEVGSLSAGLISVGGAVGIANIEHNASAYIGDRSRLTGGNITIESIGFVDSTTVKAVAGSAGAVGLGAAVSYLSSQNNSQAYVGNDATIARANNVDVTARSSSNLNADASGKAYGIAAAGIVIASAEETGATRAYLGNRVKVEDTDNLNVQAIANETVTATSQASSGGILSGNGTDTTATVDPNVAAYIGDNSTITVANNVNVLSDVAVDADAASKGGSYGALAVGLAFSKVNSNPTINTYVGENTTIEAGNVKIASSLGKAPVTGDTSFNPASAVNNSAETVTFANDHGLSTGDTVVYSNGGGNNIGGLENNAGYSVIVVDSKTIALGSQFNAATVNTKFNTISFAQGHSFNNGDKVIYQAKEGSAIDGLTSGQTYIIKLIDTNTIQLQNPTNLSEDITQGARLNGLTTTAGVTTISSTSDNVFNNGDTVVYQKRSAKFTVDESLPDTNGEANIFNLNTGDIVSKNEINSGSHGFETDDQVIYTADGAAIGGLTSGQKYYVKKVNDDKFQLSATLGGDAIDITSAPAGTSHKITAVGLTVTTTANFSYATANNNEITVTNHGFTEGQAVKYTGASSIGLTNNATYYVIKVDDNKFKLASTIGGTAISLTAAAGSHSLTATGAELEEGVTYYVKNRTETSFQLSETLNDDSIGLDTTGLTGTGASHLFVKQSVIDLTSTSTGMHNLVVDLNSSTATGTKHTLSDGASIVLPSQGDQVFSAYSQASSGAALAGSGAEATIVISPTMNTFVGSGARITSTGDVTVQGQSNVQVTGAASTKTGGLVAIGVGKLDASITNNNKTTIFNNATINAAGNVTIDGQSSHKFNVSSDSTAGGLIPVGDATSTVNLTHNTITEIRDQVNITSQRDLLVHSSSNTIGSAKASASGGGLVPFAYGTANINVLGINDTNVNAATLEGRKLTVESAVDNLDVSALGLARAAGLIGIIQAKSNINLNGTRATTNIGFGASLKADELNLNAVFRNVNSNSTALAHCDGLGGKTDSDATNYMNLTARVNTDANSTLTVNSLNVKSGFDNFNDITYAHSKKAWELRIWTPFGTIVITLDFGRAKDDDKQINPEAVTNFNSNVIRLARAVNPVLVVDANGQISLKSDNVTVTSNATNIDVSNISANGSGQIKFSSGTKSTGGLFTDNGKYSAIDPAFDTVEIQNYSNKNLIINDISTISSGSGLASPDYSQMDITNTGVATFASGTLATNPTVVTINNWGASNLILQGVINNPHDRTILYSGGNIFSQGTTQKIITRDLKMTAAGSIGANGQRIAAQLNQGYNPVTADVSDSKIYLNVEAQNSTYLNLTAKGLDSNPVTVNAQRMIAYSGEVNLAIGQTTNQANTSISALYKFTDNLDSYQSIMAGSSIVIDAGNTTTNIDAKTIFFGSQRFLDLTTGGSINVKNSPGTINLKKAISYQDTVNLSGTDILLADNGLVQAGNDVNLNLTNLSMLNNSQMQAGNDVNLLVAGNVQINSTATINAGNNVVIQGDYNNQYANESAITIGGWVYAQKMSIYGDSNKVFNIQRLATTTEIYAGGDNNIINIGSSQNRTNEILKRLNVYSGTQNAINTINVDNSGDTSNSAGILTDTSLTGLSMGEGIYYNDFKVFNLKLGSGNDDFTIINTSATTNIDSGAGDDKFRIGPKVDANGQVLDEIVNGVLIPGVNILGTKNITTIKTGAGNDYIQVNRNTDVLNIQGGIGDDTFEVNTPISYSNWLTNAKVNIAGDDGNDTTIINSSSLLETIQNNVTSIEVINSRSISLMTNEMIIINGNTGGSGSTGNSGNTNSGSDPTLSSLSDRTLVDSSNTNGGSDPTLSSLSDRNVVDSSNNDSVIDPFLLALFSR